MRDETVLGPFSPDQVIEQRVLVSFDDSVTGFLEILSKEILAHPMSRKFPDLAAFGFFIRKANIKKMLTRKVGSGGGVHMGLGLAFHIAPANVPLNFAYSLVVALLCGNPSVVRVSSKYYEQANFLISLINAVANRVKLAPIFTLVTYDHESDRNEFYSKIARIRMIWGGDSTIETFKKFRVKPDVVDIAFPNKYSISIVDAQFYLSQCEPENISSKFYDEVYTFDQNACTSPRAVVWLGGCDDANAAQKLFWRSLGQECERRGHSPSVSAMINHFSSYSKLAALNLVQDSDFDSHTSFRLLAAKVVTPQVFDSHPGEGLFYNFTVENLPEIESLFADRCQTISIIGDIRERLVHWIAEVGLSGVDRICALGTGQNFDIDWDGKDLWASMTRRFPI